MSSGEDVLAKVITFQLAEGTFHSSTLDEIGRSDGDAGAIHWIHVPPGDDDQIRTAAGILGADETDLRDLLADGDLPGMLERESSLTVTLEHGVLRPRKGSPVPRTFRLYLCTRGCLVIAGDDVDCLQAFESTYAREVQFARTSNFMLFLVLDGLVEGYLRTMGPLEEGCENLADRVFGEFDEGDNASILELRRKVLAFKRVVTHTRDILMRLSGRKIPAVTDATREALLEVYGHAQAILASTESLRDLLSTLLDAHMSGQANRMNETMKILTIFAAVFLPMTLVAGIYGMNFVEMPELGWKYGYLGAWGLILALGGGTLAFFRSRGHI